MRHLAQASQQKVVKQGIRAGSACPSKLKPPPPKLHGLPTGVPKTGVPHKVPKGADPVEQFDSVDNNYPAGAKYGAGYVNGAYQTFPFVIGRFGTCCSVGIDVFAARVQARATDLEPGNPGPGAAGPWAYWQIHSGGNPRPIVYTMGSWWSDVANSLAANGIPHCSSPTQGGCYLIWIASWNFSPGLWAGMDCRQWTDRALGENLDESTCGEWVYSSVRATDTRSFNMGWKTGWATGSSVPAKVGFSITFHPRSGPASSVDYNTGYSQAFNRARGIVYAQGMAAGRKAPIRPTTFNGSFNEGFTKCFAGGNGLGIGGVYWQGFARTNHGAPSDWSAYLEGCATGKRAGFNNHYLWGYGYGASGI